MKVQKVLIAFVAIIAISFMALIVVRPALFRASAESKPNLTATFLRFETYKVRVHDGVAPRLTEQSLAVMKVTNTGNCAISMYGYGWEAPFYYISSRACGTDWSYDYSPGFDYEKMKPIKLQPGRSMQFAAFPPASRPWMWMLGVPYCEATADEILPRRAWRAFCRLNPPQKPQYIAWSKPPPLQPPPP